MVRVEWTFSVVGEQASGYCEAYNERGPKMEAFEALEAHVVAAGGDLAPLVNLALWLVRVEPFFAPGGADPLGWFHQVYLAPGVRVRVMLP